MELFHSIIDGLGMLVLLAAAFIVAVLLAGAIATRRKTRHQDVDDLVRQRRKQQATPVTPLPAQRTIMAQGSLPWSQREREELRAAAIHRLTPTRPQPPLAS